MNGVSLLGRATAGQIQIWRDWEDLAMVMAATTGRDEEDCQREDVGRSQLRVAWEMKEENSGRLSHVGKLM